ncbi:hypothetical protein [Streptomyces europaeiscabiei]|uniref:hypothetical protein n=1 Tax=Streptomyces europaeiscabiei TaxID=146819 RepID=UPI003990741C
MDAHQRVWATSAGTFELAGLHMGITAGRHDCFWSRPNLPRPLMIWEPPHDECRRTRAPSQ